MKDYLKELRDTIFFVTTFVNANNEQLWQKKVTMEATGKTYVLCHLDGVNKDDISWKLDDGGRTPLLGKHRHKIERITYYLNQYPVYVDGVRITKQNLVDYV